MSWKKDIFISFKYVLLIKIGHYDEHRTRLCYNKNHVKDMTYMTRGQSR